MGDPMSDEFYRPSWTIDGCLEPLVEVSETEDEVVVMIDLPHVSRDNISIKATEDSIEVDAKLTRSIQWERWGTVQRKMTFKSFRKHIGLPAKVSPDDVKASFRGGVLLVRAPKLRKKVRVLIE